MWVEYKVGGVFWPFEIRRIIRYAAVCLAAFRELPWPMVMRFTKWEGGVKKWLSLYLHREKC